MPRLENLTLGTTTAMERKRAMGFRGKAFCRRHTFEQGKCSGVRDWPKFMRDRAACELCKRAVQRMKLVRKLMGLEEVA